MFDSNKCCITVYNTELNLVRQFGSKGGDLRQFDTIHGLAADEHCNLYVCDSGKSCVQVFSDHGEFLHSFSSKESGKLKHPFGVCVFGQYVYVTDNINHNLTIFTIEGEYVTSFGREGEETGNFENPWDVCVDRNGFVYVCDLTNKRIQVF